MSGIIERAAVLVYGVLAIVGLFVAGVVAGDPVAIVSAVLAAGLTYLSQSFFNYAADC